jgi:2-amino-4-hydroxy-6-hydroxymethyldihydropteridine diphosphokinase
MSYVIINMGSNLGNKRLNLSRAMRRVAQVFGDFELSHAVESKPWGYESANPYLNVCMMFQSDLDPEAVLKQLRDIEHEISPASHRNDDGSYADRIIDIDIVAIDDLVYSSPTLEVPHPRLAQRRFFLEPLAEIAPGWRHPVTHLSAHDMLRDFKEEE